MNDDDASQLTPDGSLTSRMVAVALIGALVLLVFGAAALTFLFRQTVFNDLDDRLGRVTESLLAHVEVSEAGELFIEQAPTDPSYSQVFSGRYWQIVMAEDDVSLASVSLAEVRLSLEDLTGRAVRAPGEVFVGEAEGPDGEPLRVLVQAVQIDGASGPVVIAAGEDQRPADATSRASSSAPPAFSPSSPLRSPSASTLRCASGWGRFCAWAGRSPRCAMVKNPRSLALIRRN